MQNTGRAKKTWKECLLKIEAIEKKYDEQMQPPASQGEIDDLIKAARINFKATLPDGYLNFLRVRNGLDFDGLVIYGTKTQLAVGYDDRSIEGFVEANEIWYENEEQKRFLFFGDSDISWYCLDRTTGKYEVQDKPSGTVMEVYDDFDSMLEAELKTRVA
jgi:hypothetical protein